MGCKSSDVIRFNLGPLLQSQMWVAKLKSAFSLLIIEKCCLSFKLCYLDFSGEYILYLTTDTSLVYFIDKIKQLYTHLCMHPYGRHYRQSEFPDAGLSMQV